MNTEGLNLIKEYLETPEYHNIGEKLFNCLSKEEKNELWQIMNGFEFQGYPGRDESKLKLNTIAMEVQT